MLQNWFQSEIASTCNADYRSWFVAVLNPLPNYTIADMEKFYERGGENNEL